MARTQAANYEQRRDAIVGQAAALFAQRGFLGASMSDLAAACDTSKSLFYHYYASKEDVLFAVMDSHVDQLVGDVEAAMRSGDRPSKKFASLIRAFSDHYVGAADRQKVLLNELDNLPKRQRKIIVRKQKVIVEAVQQLLGEAFGEPAEPAEARVRTMLILGMLNWTHTWFDPKGPVPPERLAEMIVEIAAQGARLARTSRSR